jgi:hypothetical protein
MKKFFKILLIVFGVFFLILLVAPFFLKKPIEKIAKEQINKSLNAKVDFSGIKISLIRNFPNAYVALENFTIVGIGEFEKDTLLSFKTFSVRVDILSAIKMTNIKVKSILLDDARVYAHVLKSGKANWDIVKPSEEVTPEDTAATEEFNFGANLKKFQIKDAYIKYQDDTAKMTAEIGNLDFLLAGNFSAKKDEMDIKSSIGSLDFLMDGVRYIKQAKAGLDAKVDADLENGVYTVKDNEIRLNELSMAITGVVKMPNDTIETDLTFKTNKADFKTLLSMVPAIYMKDFPSLQAAGALKLDGFVKGIYYDKRMPNVGLKLVVEKAMFRYPDLPKSVDNINVDLNVFYDGSQTDNSTVDLDVFHFEMAGNPFDMNMHVKTPISDMGITGGFSGKIDFSSLSDAVHLDSMTLKGVMESNIELMCKMSSIEQQKYEDVKADGSLQLTNFEFTNASLPQGFKIVKAAMAFSPKFVELSEFDARIGKSDFQLTGKLEKFIPYVFSKGTIVGVLNFSSNLIDVNEFLSGEQAEETTAQDTSSLTLFEVPERIDFTLNSKIAQMNYDKLKINDISGVIIVRNRRAVLQNLDMNLLEGSMVMNGEYNTQDIKSPFFDFKFKMNEIDVPSAYTAFNTVAKLAPVAQNCKGRISADLSLNSNLDQHMMPIYSTMAGSGELKSKSIEVGNSNTFIKIADYLKNDKFRKLSINDLDIKFTIKNGRVYVDPFETKLGSSKMTIGGDQGIDQTLNYLIKMAIPRTEFGGAANQVLTNLTSGAAAKGLNIQPGEFVNIDIGVTGTFLKPVIKPLLGSSASGSLKDMKAQLMSSAEEKVADVKKQASAKAKEQADKLIADAEAQAQKIKDAAAVAAENERKAANAAADKVQSEGSSNPLLKAATKKTADKLRKEGDNKANLITEKANAKADSIVSSAKVKAAKLEQ